MDKYLKILNKAKQRDLTADEKQSISSSSEKADEQEFKPNRENLSASESKVELRIETNRGKRYTRNKNNDQIWWSKPSARAKSRANRRRNKRKSNDASTSLRFVNKVDAFKSIMSPLIVKTIVIETNKKAKQMKAKGLRTGAKAINWRDTTTDEIYAYIAILIYAGAGKCYDVSSEDLFHVSHMAFYRAVMSQDRFEQITKFIRFDDSRTRASLDDDKLAAFRHVWTIFQTNLIRFYIPSKELAIGEQLLPIHGSCCLRQKIAKKPPKFCIKIIWIVDAETHYPLAGEIVMDKQQCQERENNVYHKLVLRLTQPYLDKDYNITMDKVFTSIPLALQLIAQKTSIVGTIGRNEVDLPKEFTIARRKEPDSSIFGFSGSMILVSYVNANKKNILALSTAHADEVIDQSTFQPEILVDYLSKKFKLHEMLRLFTCKRKNNRWTMALFFNMIDAATFCTQRLFDDTISESLREKRKFYESLSLELATPHILRRIKKPKLRKSTKMAMQSLGFEVPMKYELPEIKRSYKQNKLLV